MFFENSLLKDISGQNMSDPLKWSLTDDPRFLQAPIHKNFIPRSQIIMYTALAKSVKASFIKAVMNYTVLNYIIISCPGLSLQFRVAV